VVVILIWYQISLGPHLKSGFKKINHYREKPRVRPIKRSLDRGGVLKYKSSTLTLTLESFGTVAEILIDTFVGYF